jgi:hypothetical protein
MLGVGCSAFGIVFRGSVNRMGTTRINKGRGRREQHAECQIGRSPILTPRGCRAQSLCAPRRRNMEAAAGNGGRMSWRSQWRAIRGGNWHGTRADKRQCPTGSPAAASTKQSLCAEIIALRDRRPHKNYFARRPKDYFNDKKHTAQVPQNLHGQADRSFVEQGPIQGTADRNGQGCPKSEVGGRGTVLPRGKMKTATLILMASLASAGAQGAANESKDCGKSFACAVLVWPRSPSGPALAMPC